MPAPFGFGVGDFIAVIELIVKVRKALKDSGGALSEFQDVVQELGSLQSILTHLGTIHFKERAGTSPALNLTQLIATCQRPLSDFLDHIARFQSSLNASTSRNFIHTSPRKAQWGLFMGAEIVKLRSVVAAKILQLQLVLQSFSMYDLLQDRNLHTRKYWLTSSKRIARVRRSKDRYDSFIRCCRRFQHTSSARQGPKYVECNSNKLGTELTSPSRLYRISGENDRGKRRESYVSIEYARKVPKSLFPNIDLLRQIYPSYCNDK